MPGSRPDKTGMEQKIAPHLLTNDPPGVNFQAVSRRLANRELEFPVMGHRFPVIPFAFPVVSSRTSKSGPIITSKTTAGVVAAPRRGASHARGRVRALFVMVFVYENRNLC
jgi:hypothetical protein